MSFKEATIMDFPWEVIPIFLGATAVVVVIMAAPAILGSLIGQIIRFFRSILGGGDDDI